MDVKMTDDKHMSLDDLIKRDKAKKKGPGGPQKGGPSKGIGGKMRNVKANALQGGRPRFAGKEFRAGPPQSARSNQMQKGTRDRLPLGKAKKTGNMIMKRRENAEVLPSRKLKGMPMKNARPGQVQQQQQQRGPPGRLDSGRKMHGTASTGFRSSKIMKKAGMPQQQRGDMGGPMRGSIRQERGGLASDRKRRVLNQPKQQKTLRVGGIEKPQQPQKIKALKSSDRRLKVRNIDDEQVTNDDLKKLFANIGELEMCVFDRNNWGHFMGSATVLYKRPEDAKRAIEEYHEAFLDDKVLTVEYDLVKTTFPSPTAESKKGPVLRKEPTSNGKGKTLTLKQKS